jgi:Flp pilus assembly protein TadD
MAQFQHAVDLDPTFMFFYMLFSIVLNAMGRLDEAVSAARRANELSGGNATTLWPLGSAYARAGRIAEARQILEELTEERRSTYVPASALALVHAGLGHRDESLEWLARSIEERDPIIVTSLKTAWTYDPLRPGPAYQALLRKMNLEP